MPKEEDRRLPISIVAAMGRLCEATVAESTEARHAREKAAALEEGLRTARQANANLENECEGLRHDLATARADRRKLEVELESLRAHDADLATSLDEAMSVRIEDHAIGYIFRGTKGTAEAAIAQDGKWYVSGVGGRDEGILTREAAIQQAYERANGNEYVPKLPDVSSERARAAGVST